MKLYVLTASFGESIQAFGVFSTPDRAQAAAERLTPKADGWAASVLWTPHYLHPGDPVQSWEGHIAQVFKPVPYLPDIVGWVVGIQELDKVWWGS